jgi:hypothetical protein
MSVFDTIIAAPMANQNMVLDGGQMSELLILFNF